MTHELWKDRPWIFPSLLGRSLLAIIAGSVISWLELFFNIALMTFLRTPALLWTTLGIFLFWAASIARLLVTRASYLYILRNDSLEVRSGILSSKSFVVAPTGFSDLEVTRSTSSRLMNTGEIMVRTQGEKIIRMIRVRDPLTVADQIREVMAKPSVRLERQEVTAQ